MKGDAMKVKMTLALLALCLCAWLFVPPPQDTAAAVGDSQAFQASYIYDGGTRCEIKRVSGVAAGGAPGTDTVIAAVTGKKIRIMSMHLMATATTVNEIYLTNGDNSLYGNSGNGVPLDVAGIDGPAGFSLDWNPGGWLETDTAAEAVVLNTSAAQDVIYVITYIEVD